jgi:hypothetical protein
MLEHVGRVLAAEQRFQEQAVAGAVQAASGGDVLVTVAGGLDVGQQQGDPDPDGVAAGAERLDAVAEVEVVGGADGVSAGSCRPNPSGRRFHAGHRQPHTPYR